MFIDIAENERFQTQRFAEYAHTHENFSVQTSYVIRNLNIFRFSRMNDSDQYLLKDLKAGHIKATYGPSYIGTINLIFFKRSCMYAISCHYVQSMEVLLSAYLDKFSELNMYIYIFILHRICIGPRLNVG